MSNGLLNAGSIFSDYLLEDERVLWAGQPNSDIFFTNNDFLVIPFSFLIEFISIFVLYQSTIGYPLLSGFAISFLFNVIGLYVLFGRFIYKRLLKKNTYYAISNIRIMRLYKYRANIFRYKYLKDINKISKQIGKNGIGTINFPIFRFHGPSLANTGLDFIIWIYGDIYSFYDIDNANFAYDLLQKSICPVRR